MHYSNQPDQYPLGMSYVPWHHWEKLFAPDQALEAGTAFPSLEFVFCPKGGRR